jgi:glutamate 5-kinase
MHSRKFKRIAVKIGSNVLAGEKGMLDTTCISRIVDQIFQLKKNGVEVILISSGAVASGRALFPVENRIDTVSARQLWSAIGQVKLMNTYSEFFDKHNLVCAQVLTTKENFSDRRHYLNMKNCISTVLENNVVPIVNENDTISVTELMFTDNDELSGLISSMMNCDALIILSNVDGIYNGTPGDEGVSVIPEIQASDDSLEDFISTQKSGFGRGGMHTKYNVARKIALEGIPVFIGNGRRANIIIDIVKHQKTVYTRFNPSVKRLKSNKKWLAHSDSFAKGVVVVNQGARDALFDVKANSLLMIGVTKIKGFFEKGDIIKIEDEQGNQLGLGKAQYNSEEAKDLIGKKAEKPLVYYDYMYLYDLSASMHSNQE